MSPSFFDLINQKQLGLVGKVKVLVENVVKAELLYIRVLHSLKLCSMISQEGYKER